jgi:exopolysaccharide biosynthesis protein
MKKIQIILIMFAIVFSLSSCEKLTNVEVTVIKDCTGSYLRYEGKDFHICNYETVKNIENETIIKASFKKVEKCNSDTLAVCMMYHENEGWIEVLEIKKL